MEYDTAGVIFLWLELRFSLTWTFTSSTIDSYDASCTAKDVALFIVVVVRRLSPLRSTDIAFEGQRQADTRGACFLPCSRAMIKNIEKREMCFSASLCDQYKNAETKAKRDGNIHTDATAPMPGGSTAKPPSETGV